MHAQYFTDTVERSATLAAPLALHTLPPAPRTPEPVGLSAAEIRQIIFDLLG